MWREQQRFIFFTNALMSKYDNVWYISILFSITSCFSRTVHIMHFYFTQLILLGLSVSQPSLLSVKISCSITFHRFPFGSCYSDRPAACTWLNGLEWILVSDDQSEITTDRHAHSRSLREQNTVMKMNEVDWLNVWKWAFNRPFSTSLMFRKGHF